MYLLTFYTLKAPSDIRHSSFGAVCERVIVWTMRIDFMGGGTIPSDIGNSKGKKAKSERKRIERS